MKIHNLEGTLIALLCFNPQAQYLIFPTQFTHTHTHTHIYIYIYTKCFKINTPEFSECLRMCNSRDSSVGIALGYGLDDRGSRVRFQAGARSFSLHHRVQNGSGAHPASYPMGTRGSFPGGKAAGA
jgi:hypothetical protein